MVIGGVEVTDYVGMEAAELREYVEYVKERISGVSKLEVRSDGDFVELTYIKAGIPFERIRRITGYLTGDLKTWNDAKKSEERERVKHAGIADVAGATGGI